MRTKDVVVNGVQYRVRKMDVDTGTYIYMRMMRAVAETAEKRVQANLTAQEAPEPDSELTPEQKAKLLCGMAFVYGIDFEDSKFIRRAAMQASSTVNQGPSNELVLPVMSSDGRWTPPAALSDDPASAQELTLEVLAFNLAPFFEKRLPATQT